MSCQVFSSNTPQLFRSLTSDTMVVIVAACVIFAITGSASAATPTNCTISGCGFGGKCIDNAAGTASTCVCYQGFELSLQTFECIDINECNYTSAALCPNGFCHNMYGDYKCNCSRGFVPHFPDGKTCVRPIFPFINNNNNNNNNNIFGNMPIWLLSLLFGEM
ncbi:uromodulin-like [Haliotis cracherodii]|uniref:uromodulin-like n=1 Tax=Haliotis cracherodii TaxID=6455 RepID=UPI0039EC7B0B